MTSRGDADFGLSCFVEESVVMELFGSYYVDTFIQ